MDRKIRRGLASATLLAVLALAAGKDAGAAGDAKRGAQF